MTKATLSSLKRLCALGVVLALIFTLTGCGKPKETAFKKYKNAPKHSGLITNENVASNERFTMGWNNEDVLVTVTDNVTGQTWATAPYDYCRADSNMTHTSDTDVLYNPVNVEYLIDDSNNLATMYWQAKGETGSCYRVQKIKNGLLVYYFFDSIELVVPLVYQLFDDHFSVSVDPSRIYEGKYQLYRIDISPYMASVANSKQAKNRDSYVFVPSGGGALMYTDSRGMNGRNYNETLYGSDYAKLQDAVDTNEYGATMPVFGISDGQRALVGIIESGAACCSVKATAGGYNGFSNVYASFALRGHTTEKIALSYGGSKTYQSYSTGHANTLCTVSYYPIDASEGYVGMADCYRNYLQKNQGLKTNVSTSPLYLQVLGGAKVDRSLVGVPYDTVADATTLKQAGTIAQTVSKDTGIKPVLQLKGFGDSGEDIGKLAGGYTVNSAFGSFDDVAALQKSFATYFDFDVIRYTKSGNGFSYSKDGAKAMNMSAASHYVKYAAAMNNGLEEQGVYHMIRRSELSKVVTKAVDKLQKESIKGISLATVGQIAYSDYRSTNYYNKCNMDTDVAAILKKAGSRVSVMTQNAFSYAAVQADHVVASPIKSSAFSIFDADIPFYQMVFKGSVSLSGPSLTMVGNAQDTFLRTLEGGCGLLFTVTDHYNNDFLYDQSGFAASVFKNQREQINRYLNDKTKAYLTDVADCTITGHRILDDGITETVFSNGKTLVVNRSNAAYTTDSGTVAANDFNYQ